MVRIERLDESKDIDYGKMADKLADEDSYSGSEQEDSDQDDDEEEMADDNHDDRDNDEFDDDGEDQDDDLEDDDDASDVQDNGTAIKPSLRATFESNEPCSFDIRNLLAMNTHGVNEAKLYQKKKKQQDEDLVTIAPDNLPALVNEEYLLEKAVDGCSQLLSVLWQLPVERSDAGPLGTLPKFDELPLPRSLPPPPPKQMTKWEKFAKEKGIALNKNKRSRKVWDEATNSWKYRHGYEKANDDTKEWPIMEVKANQDPFEDPWERARDEKKARRERNQESRMKNMERAGLLSKGTAKSVTKQRSSAREAGKAGGNMDRDNVPPAGVPVDITSSKDGVPSNTSKRGKLNTLAALKATQRSTASLGRFDKMLEGEPARKTSAGPKKRKFESDSDKKVMATEAERSMKVLKSVVEGGGVAKEKAIKKGRLAHGETGHDYDYDDGLGASAFRKKKGRAGAGKAKKLTKKRIK